MKMKCENTGTIIDVHRYYMTKNFWEFFLEKPDENGMAFGLVMGNETELGYTNVNEIKSSIVLVGEADELGAYGILPATGWQWFTS